MVVTSATGLPWYVSATVISLAHMESLRKESATSAPGEHPEFLGIRYATSPDPAPGDPLPVAAEPGDRDVPTLAGRSSFGAACVPLGMPPVPVAIKAAKSRDPGGWEGRWGLGAPEGPQGTHDTCTAACREQRLTGLAVFVLTGVSVFMAPVLKVGSPAAGFGLFCKAGVRLYPARLGGFLTPPSLVPSVHHGKPGQQVGSSALRGKGLGKGFGLSAAGRPAHQCTAAPCQLANLPAGIGVPCGPQTHPTAALHTATWGAKPAWCWLSPAAAATLGRAPPVYPGHIWITWGQAGGPFSSTSVLTSEDGLVKPLIVLHNILTSKLERYGFVG